MDIDFLGVIFILLIILSPIALIIALISGFRITDLLKNKKQEKAIKWLILLALAILWLVFYEKFIKDSKEDYSHNIKIEQSADNSSQQNLETQKEIESGI